MKRNKIIALFAMCAVFTSACFGVQTFYAGKADANQVVVNTAELNSSENFGGGYESTRLLNPDFSATQLATSTTGSLQSSLETETAERKTQDEKISKSIGAINNTLLGYIGSASTSNIGDGTLRGAIGNTSIAGIGTENNITSAIVGLNDKIGSTNIAIGSNKIGDGTVTGAISSLNGTMTSLQSTVDNQFKDVVFTRSVSMTSGGEDVFSCPESAPTNLSGYHLVTFSTYTSSANQSMLNSVPQADGRFAVRLHNHINSTQTIKIYIRCLYEKN